MSRHAAPIDVESLLVAYLLDDTDVGTLVGNGVSTELPADLERRLPWLQLLLLPGGYADTNTAWLLAARVQFSAWAMSKGDAFDLASVAVRALCGAEDVDHELGVVNAVTIDAAPYWSPDPETDRPRYLFIATVHAHPLATNAP
jgi:hypothetical protein